MKTTRLSIFPSLSLSSPFLTSVFPLLLTFLTFFAASVATAQSIKPSVINSTGGTATVGNFIVDWNVGESMITMQTNGIIVTNGQLQPVDEIISVEEFNIVP